MKKRLVIVAVVVGLLLATAVPVFAGAENACNAGVLRGIFDPTQANPAVVFIADNFVDTIFIGLTSGVTIVISYDENLNVEPNPLFPFGVGPPFGGFQCINLLTGQPSDDEITSILAMPPGSP